MGCRNASKATGYFRCLPEQRHFYGKDLIFPIESTNGDIRHRLARFKREAKASSRSLEMVEVSLKLFHYSHDYPQNVVAFMTSKYPAKERI
jgi:IS1 family transposase